MRLANTPVYLAMQGITELLLYLSYLQSGVLAETFESMPTQICVSWHSSGTCIGGVNALTSTEVTLSYNFTDSQLTIEKNATNVIYELDNCDSNCTYSKYTFVQLEHGGGDCNCVDIYFDDNCTTEGLDLYIHFI